MRGEVKRLEIGQEGKLEHHGIFLPGSLTWDKEKWFPIANGSAPFGQARHIRREPDGKITADIELWEVRLTDEMDFGLYARILRSSPYRVGEARVIYEAEIKGVSIILAPSFPASLQL